MIALSVAVLGARAQGQPARPASGAQQMQRAAHEEAQREGAEQETKSELSTPQEEGAPQQQEKRSVPDYDGRGPRPTTFGEGLLWVPRIIASPLYLTAKYVIAAPLGALVTTVEKNQLTFRGDRESGWNPLIVYDLGLRPNIGVYIFWNRAFSPAKFVQCNCRLRRGRLGGIGAICRSENQRAHLPRVQRELPPPAGFTFLRHRAE